MNNYKYLQNLIAEYQSILHLCRLAGVREPESIKFKLDTCFYMLGLTKGVNK